MEPEWISRLLGHSWLSDHSRALYGRCLVYWNSWHTARYGVPLSLARVPIAPISNAALKAFVEDHIPVVTGGHVTPLMDGHISEALRNMGFNRRISCSSESTTLWRLLVIQSVHRRWGLEFDLEKKAALALQLHGEWIGANASLAMDRNSPTGRDIVLRLRHACPDNRDGVRIATVITLLQYLTPEQLANLRFGDLIPGYIDVHEQKIQVVEINIREPINRFQAIFPKPRLTWLDASAVTLWGCVRLYDEFGEGVETAPPELPFLVRDRPNGSVAVTAKWVTAKLNEIVLHSCMESVLQNKRRRYWASAIRLRCQRESEHQRRLMEIAHASGITTSTSIYSLLRARRK